MGGIWNTHRTEYHYVQKLDTKKEVRNILEGQVEEGKIIFK
jgi:hypothetical protein